MASAVRDYGFLPKDTYATPAPSSRKGSIRRPVPVTQGRQALDIGGYAKFPNRLFGQRYGGTSWPVGDLDLSLRCATMRIERAK